MSNKLRITLIDKESNKAISDRLIDSALEYANGPKDKHSGPIELSVRVEDKGEVQSLITYLGQLALELPLSEKAKKVYTPANQSILKKEPLQEVIDTALAKPNQEALILFLRELNFAFISYDHLKEIHDKNGWPLKLKKPAHEEYQFMVRVTRLAKDPKNDKIDPGVAFAIKLIGKRVPGLHIYLMGKFSKSVKKDWENSKVVNFKVKEKFYKFPDPMTYDERAKWRAEDRKFLTDPEYKPTPFYERWKPFVTILQPLKLK